VEEVMMEFDYGKSGGVSRIDPHEDKKKEGEGINATKAELMAAIDSLLLSKSVHRRHLLFQCSVAINDSIPMRIDPRELEGHLKDVETLIMMLSDILSIRPNDRAEQSLFIREWTAGRNWLAFLDRVARRDAEAGPQECYELRLSIDGVVVAGERGKGTLKDALGRMIEGK
jgi:hypothetical protein